MQLHVSNVKLNTQLVHNDVVAVHLPTNVVNSTLRPRQNAYDIFKCILLNDKVFIYFDLNFIFSLLLGVQLK